MSRGGTLAVTALMFVVGGCATSGPPSASETGSPSATADASAPAPSDPASASAAPSASDGDDPRPASTDLTWTTTGSFEGGGGPAIVHDAAAADGVLVAVGVAYDESLPTLGPTPPHVGRIWSSADGRQWEEIELGADVGNVTLTDVIVRGDGSFLATGVRLSDDGFGPGEPAALASTDGQSWEATDSGLPDRPFRLVQGARGYVAHVPALSAGEQAELWHSADGAAWELVKDLPGGALDFGAGEEGFVGAGLDGDSGEPYVIASADGIEWLESPSPPPAPIDVVPLGPDWISATGVSDDAPEGTTWFSADGLAWEEHGAVELGSARNDEVSCTEFPAWLVGAGPWVVLNTALAHPCSEGGFQTYGTQLITVDGASWVALPFEPGTPGESRSGASVNAAIALGGALVLAGEEDGKATFWLGEAE